MRSKLDLRLTTSNADVHPAEYPPDAEDSYRGEEDGERLPEACEEWVVVGDDDVAVPHLVDHVQRSELQRGAANGVHEGAVKRVRCLNEFYVGVEFDVAGMYQYTSVRIILVKLTLRLLA